MLNPSDKVHRHGRRAVVLDSGEPTASSPGIATDNETPLPQTPLASDVARPRSGCTLRLYADACDGDPLLSGAELEHGCFNDIHGALDAATHFIYVAAWMFTPEIRLRRHGTQHETVGELLRRKADAGVHVCMLVWCCAGEVVATRFNEASTFFCDSAVRFRLCKGAHEWLRRDVLQSATWSRHQKLVVCDNGAGGVVAFVGGLDMASGRWDTPQHRLFVAPDDPQFQTDIYNGERDQLKESPAGWPRQPWHDVHARVTGPITRDLIELFESRWRVELGSGYVKDLPGLPEDENALSSGLRSNEPLSFDAIGDSSHAHWRLQQLISYPGQDPQIQNAYVDAIDGAQSLVYIENQYFIGGLKADRGVENAIPRRLARKIADGICGRGPGVRAVVVIPLHPEGALDSTRAGYAGQCTGAIVGLQLETMQIMHHKVAKALRAQGRDAAEWTQYLAFFSLANREPAEPGSVMPDRPGDKGALLARTRRYMVYVHSKFLCVDDARAIVGSANINERSMSGGRDSEVALLCTPGDSNDTTLRDFRCRLMAEHAGGTASDWARMSAPDALAELWRRAKLNWAAYVNDQAVSKLPHNHIVPHPVAIVGGKLTWMGVPDCTPPLLVSATVPDLLVN